ncbi:hypothetical protein H8959_010314 [Pygathrix nigripes]
MLQVVQEGNLAPFVINTIKRGRRDRERQRTPWAPHPLGLQEGTERLHGTSQGRRRVYSLLFVLSSFQRRYIYESPNHRGKDCSFLAQK